MSRPNSTVTAVCPICGAVENRCLLSCIRDWEYGVEGVWSHIRCESCSMVWLSPFPGLEQLKRAYNIDYHGHAESTSKGAIYRILFDINNWLVDISLRRFVRTGATILDIGCGSGEFSNRFLRLGAAQVDGIDFSPKAVALARERGLNARECVFPDFKAAPESYDIIVMNNYLEHTLAPRVEIEKVYSLLRPGGWLIGEIPNYASLDRWLFGRYWGGNHAPRHTFQFEPQTILKLLHDVGFVDSALKHQINSAHFALSIQNFLQRNHRDLRRNKHIKNGRASYYPMLLLVTLPINMLGALAGYSGLMRFQARKFAEG